LRTPYRRPGGLAYYLFCVLFGFVAVLTKCDIPVGKLTISFSVLDKGI